MGGGHPVVNSDVASLSGVLYQSDGSVETFAEALAGSSSSSVRRDHIDEVRSVTFNPTGSGRRPRPKPDSLGVAEQVAGLDHQESA